MTTIKSSIQLAYFVLLSIIINLQVMLPHDIVIASGINFQQSQYIDRERRRCCGHGTEIENDDESS
ncbi:MAG: hypothetical protein VSS52_014175 [Thiotrichaceae bacterium]|nr:hypothetical protein [Thiotrichaceae bacterium]